MWRCGGVGAHTQTLLRSSDVLISDTQDTCKERTLIPSEAPTGPLCSRGALKNKKSAWFLAHLLNFMCCTNVRYVLLPAAYPYRLQVWPPPRFWSVQDTEAHALHTGQVNAMSLREIHRFSMSKLSMLNSDLKLILKEQKFWLLKFRIFGKNLFHHLWVFYVSRSIICANVLGCGPHPLLSPDLSHFFTLFKHVLVELDKLIFQSR